MRVVLLFTLGRPETPKLSDAFVSFDGSSAAEQMRTIVTDFPQRTAGSDADNRCGYWVFDQFQQLGLDAHMQGFAARVEGRDLALQNVWALVPGSTEGAILIVANRDVPPRATQGANNNASGLAALLELARVTAATQHNHTLIFLATSGDALGGVGASEFLREYQDSGDLVAVVALRSVATRERDGVSLNGWSSRARVAPPWLWLLFGPAARVYAREEALLPSVATQVMHLAAPTATGSQAPFVANGIPGIEVSAKGPRVTPQDDVLDTVSGETLGRMGSAIQAAVAAIDAGPVPPSRSNGTIFLTRQRTLSGWALRAMLLALFLPLVLVTVDLLARCRRERVILRSAFLRAGLHFGPWLIVIALLYFANTLGLLPRVPGGAIPSGLPMVEEPRYARVALLLVVLVAAYAYAVTVARRLETRVKTDPRATMLVAHLSLVLIAAGAVIVSAYSLLLLVPAALIWPLVRPGEWYRSVLPAYAGLVMVPVVLVALAMQADVGWHAWWYFFLLVETRVVPILVVLGGALFFSAAGMLAHTLHGRDLTASALGWASTMSSRTAGSRCEPRRPLRIQAKLRQRSSRSRRS